MAEQKGMDGRLAFETFSRLLPFLFPLPLPSFPLQHYPAPSMQGLRRLTLRLKCYARVATQGGRRVDFNHEATYTVNSSLDDDPDCVHAVFLSWVPAVEIAQAAEAARAEAGGERLTRAFLAYRTRCS